MKRVLWYFGSFLLYSVLSLILWCNLPKGVAAIVQVFTSLGFRWITVGGIVPLLVYASYSLWIFAVLGYCLRRVREWGRDKEIWHQLLFVGITCVIAVLLWILPVVGGVVTYRIALSQMPKTPQFAAIISLLFGVGGVFGVVGPLVVGSPRKEEDVYIRGSQKTAFLKARQKIEKREQFSPRFGGLYLAVRSATQHFLFIGRTGAAKSFSIDILLAAVLPAIGVKPDERALIYDHKGATTALLDRLGVPWKLLHPFDMRSVAWDIAADCVDEAGAREIAEILLPLRKESQPFFPMAAQELFVGIVMTFITNKMSWDLFEAVSTLRDQEKVKALLPRSPAGRNLMSLYFEMQEGMPSKSGHDVRATAFTYLGRLATIAAAWRKLGERNGKISLDKWANNRGSDNYALILGRSHKNKVVMEAMYQVIFARLAEIIEDQKDSGQRRTWIVFDEAFMAGRLPKIEELLVYGRTRGAVMVWGFQSWFGIEAVYGREIASQIIGQFGHWGLFRMDTDTARKVSEVIGEQQRDRYRKSRSVNSSDRSISISHQWDEKTEPLILPSELSKLKMPKPWVGLPGYYMTVELDSETGVLWKHTLNWWWVEWMRHKLYGEQFLFYPNQEIQEELMEQVPPEWGTSGDWKFDQGNESDAEGYSSTVGDSGNNTEGYPLIWIEDEDSVEGGGGSEDRELLDDDFPPM